MFLLVIVFVVVFMFGYIFLIDSGKKKKII